MKTLAAAFILALLIGALAVAGMKTVDSVKAASDDLAEPPVITILSPENKTYATNNITLSFNISIGRLNRTYDPVFLDLVNIDRVYFMGDWQQNSTYVDQYNNTYVAPKSIGKPCKTLTFSCDLIRIPDGKHSILVHATEKVPFLFDLLTDVTSSLSVNFTIDTPPSISILSPEAKAYNTSDVSLNFTVNESPSRIAYSLDGRENVTVTGNTTLTGLSNGAHNVTVYAWDNVGNIGASETIHFTVAQPSEPQPSEPFPTTWIAAAIAVIVTGGAIALGVAIYRRKRSQT